MPSSLSARASYVLGPKSPWTKPPSNALVPTPRDAAAAPLPPGWSSRASSRTASPHSGGNACQFVEGAQLRTLVPAHALSMHKNTKILCVLANLRACRGGK